MTRGGTILWALVLVTLALLSRWSPLGVAPNTIRWVTQSEVEIFGYDIYRGPGQEGPFTIINPQSILE